MFQENELLKLSLNWENQMNYILQNIMKLLKEEMEKRFYYIPKNSKNLLFKEIAFQLANNITMQLNKSLMILIQIKAKIFILNLNLSHLITIMTTIIKIIIINNLSMSQKIKFKMVIRTINAIKIKILIKKLKNLLLITMNFNEINIIQIHNKTKSIIITNVVLNQLMITNYKT